MSIAMTEEVGGVPASVTVRLPSVLRAYSGCPSELPAQGATVRDVLGELEVSQPTLYRSVCDETGAVRRHVNVFVNASDIRDLEALETRLASGDVISILPAVSGGSACRSV
jgi:molybdopterin converting factor small subunit